MLVAEMLHSVVPALVVTEVDELLQQDRSMLTGDRRHAAVADAEAVTPVAGGAGLEKLRSVREVGCQSRGFDQFAPGFIAFVQGRARGRAREGRNGAQNECDKRSAAIVCIH